MKKLLGLLGVAILLVGCGVQQPSLKLHWGDVVYESTGDHALKELDVTRTMADGSQITVRVGSSDSKEVQATMELIKTLSQAVGKIPEIR